ncbi:hypothetical protein AB2T14_001136 [Clostridium botulinum]
MDINMKFDWEGFKNNEFAVLCDTQEKAEDFIKQCHINRMHWFNGDKEETFWNECKEETCYCNNYDYNNTLGYGRKKLFLKEDYKIVEWEMESPFIENKIGYDREYNIMEIKEFPENTEFIDSLGLKIRFNNRNCMEVFSNKTKKWVECKLTKNWLNSKFKLVKKDKKVTALEAMQAYYEYKTIKCIWLKDNIYEFDGNEGSRLIDIKEEGMLLNLILNGEWYIKED